MFRKTSNKQGVISSAGMVLALFASSSGISFSQIIKQTGMNIGQLMSNKGRWSHESIAKLLKLIDDSLPSDVSASLKFAAIAPYNLIGSLLEPLMKAPDVGSFFQIFIRGQCLVDELDVSLIDMSDMIIVSMYHETDATDEGMGAEGRIGLFSRFIREYFGKNVIFRIQFIHTPRVPLKVYEDFFGVGIDFECQQNGLVLEPKALEVVNKKQGTSVETISVLLQHIDELLYKEGIVQDDDLSDVRVAIQHNAEKADYSATSLASTMAMSLRNLQRRLQKSGTSTRILLDDKRQANAIKFLANQKMGMEQVAESLGFESERGFRRAFERWTEKTPSQVRKEMRSTAG